MRQCQWAHASLQWCSLGRTANCQSQLMGISKSAVPWRAVARWPHASASATHDPLPLVKGGAACDNPSGGPGGAGRTPATDAGAQGTQAVVNLRHGPSHCFRESGTCWCGPSPRPHARPNGQPRNVATHPAKRDTGTSTGSWQHGAGPGERRAWVGGGLDSGVRRANLGNLVSNWRFCFPGCSLEGCGPVGANGATTIPPAPSRVGTCKAWRGRGGLGRGGRLCRGGRCPRADRGPHRNPSPRRT